MLVYITFTVLLDDDVYGTRNTRSRGRIGRRGRTRVSDRGRAQIPDDASSGNESNGKYKQMQYNNKCNNNTCAIIIYHTR